MKNINKGLKSSLNEGWIEIPDLNEVTDNARTLIWDYENCADAYNANIKDKLDLMKKLIKQINILLITAKENLFDETTNKNFKHIGSSLYMYS